MTDLGQTIIIVGGLSLLLWVAFIGAVMVLLS